MKSECSERCFVSFFCTVLSCIDKLHMGQCGWNSVDMLAVVFKRGCVLQSQIYVLNQSEPCNIELMLSSQTTVLA